MLSLQLVCRAVCVRSLISLLYMCLFVCAGEGVREKEEKKGRENIDIVSTSHPEDKALQ